MKRGSVLCAQTTDALVPPLTEWVNSDGETDPNWTLTQVDYEDKRKEYPAPLSLRLMEVDALQRAVALESLSVLRLDAQLQDGSCDGTVKKQLENQRDVVKASRDAALRRLADQVFVSTCSDIAPDLTETSKRYDALFRSLKNQDAETLVSLRSICTKLSTSDKKLRQRLSTNALRFGFATTRTSQQTVDAYDVRFALGLIEGRYGQQAGF